MRLNKAVIVIFKICALFEKKVHLICHFLNQILYYLLTYNEIHHYYIL